VSPRRILSSPPRASSKQKADEQKPELTLYGIRNCDTVRKARRWLDEQGVDYEFHDFRRTGCAGALAPLDRAAQGWERHQPAQHSWKALPTEERSHGRRRCRRAPCARRR
jgi:hypothetical protein